MLFNSYAFLVFLAVVLPLYYVLAHRWQNRMLLVASYIFYAAWDWRFLGLLFIQTVVDYFAALGMGQDPPPARRRLYLLASLGVNLGILGFFKYFNFFIDSFGLLLRGFGGTPPSLALHILLPAGISFYTFQTMAYTIDVYRRREPVTRDFLTFALYVSYFPHLVAGPIMRAGHLIPQLAKPRTVTREMLTTGVQLILMGYLKKVGIADPIAGYVEKAFADPGSFSAPALLLSLYLFAIQIYCDFSGYTDIARGVSRLFGIELTLNFLQPYFARNITEFWHRWHISLSTWLRDYLYIPLGGNRHGAWRTYCNLMITMLLGGLWHGASWTFVAWGGLHGLYLAVHKFLAGGRKVGLESPPRGLREWLTFLPAAIATFHLVCLTWIFFRAPDFGTAWTYLTGLFAHPLSVVADSGGVPDYAGRLVAVGFYGLLMVLIDFGCWRRAREFPLPATTPALVRGFAYATALLIISFVGGSQVVPFIYFQF
jgi:D-alanyl-lipoteichoic acid acyltransferase DltB (MBOAT superfamily)